MTVEVYLGKKFEHSHERRALAWFLKDMLAGFGEGDILYQVIVETKVELGRHRSAAHQPDRHHPCRVQSVRPRRRK